MRTKAYADTGNKQLSRMNAKTEMGRNVQRVSRLHSRCGIVGNAGDLELDAPLSGQRV